MVWRSSLVLDRAHRSKYRHTALKTLYLATGRTTFCQNGDISSLNLRCWAAKCPTPAIPVRAIFCHPHRLTTDSRALIPRRAIADYPVPAPVRYRLRAPHRATAAGLAPPSGRPLIAPAAASPASCHSIAPVRPSAIRSTSTSLPQCSPTSLLYHSTVTCIPERTCQAWCDFISKLSVEMMGCPLRSNGAGATPGTHDAPSHQQSTLPHRSAAMKAVLRITVLFHETEKFSKSLDGVGGRRQYSGVRNTVN